MRKIIFTFIALLVATASWSQTKTYHYPGDEPIVSLKVPSKTWIVNNESAWMSIKPDDNTEEGRMIAMIWKSDNPDAEDAVTILVDESFELIESILVDIEWGEETTEFDNNDISFVGIDGNGYYVNDDNSKDQMMVSVSILILPDGNLLTFVFFGLEDAYTKHKDELIDIMLSITPTK